MSVRLYDDALVKKIKNWVKDEEVRILSPDETLELFQKIANDKNDEPISLPIISLTRSREVDLDHPHKKMMTFDGMMLDATVDKSLQIDAIPMTLNYQLDIYTRYKYEADEYMRNFVFNLVNHPKVKVVLPYNDINYTHYSNVRLIPTIEDNSDVPNRLVSDQFTRWTISFTIDDAYLFSLPYKSNVQIVGFDVECEEN